MNCPKCGTQNPDDVELCTTCNSPLNQPPVPAENIKVKTSRIAIASLIFGILTLFAFPLFLVSGFHSCVWPIVAIVTAILALILGIIALVRIGLSAGRLTGKAFAVIGTVIPVVLFFSIIFLSALFYKPPVAFRMVCGSNLSGIGRAMLIYANDYDNNFPRAGGPDTIWQPKINDWQAKDRRTAFFLNPDGTGGSATISSSLYLLVKYTEVAPRSFCCKQDPGIRAFLASDYIPNMEDEDAWDFGPEPTKHYSYSYHMPYGPYPLSPESSDPGQAVAADRNPWLDPHTDTTGFKWNDKTMTGGRENIKRYQKGNTGPHKREGQNVLFVDIHVYFEKLPFCGVNDDNIYTYWNGSDIQQGAPPTLTSQPADKLDSLLVNEQPKEDKK